jgi:hypothetical protein
MRNNFALRIKAKALYCYERKKGGGPSYVVKGVALFVLIYRLYVYMEPIFT